MATRFYTVNLPDFGMFVDIVVRRDRTVSNRGRFPKQGSSWEALPWGAASRHDAAVVLCNARSAGWPIERAQGAR
jgi:hypothetical protein